MGLEVELWSQSSEHVLVNNLVKSNIAIVSRVISLTKVVHTTYAVVKLKPEKIQAQMGILTNDFCITGAVLFQLSYQAMLELVTL